jgi:hypothetical protein
MDEDKALEYLAKCIDINPKNLLAFNTLGKIQQNRKIGPMQKFIFKKILNLIQNMFILIMVLEMPFLG